MQGKRFKKLMISGLLLCFSLAVLFTNGCISISAPILNEGVWTVEKISAAIGPIGATYCFEGVTGAGCDNTEAINIRPVIDFKAATDLRKLTIQDMVAGISYICDDDDIGYDQNTDDEILTFLLDAGVEIDGDYTFGTNDQLTVDFSFEDGGTTYTVSIYMVRKGMVIYPINDACGSGYDDIVALLPPGIVF